MSADKIGVDAHGIHFGQPATLALSGEYFYSLLAGLDANVYGGTEAIRGGVIPGLFGFRMNGAAQSRTALADSFA